MHENREISCTSWPTDQDRSAKAINRTAGMKVQEKSDCAVVAVNQPNNGVSLQETIVFQSPASRCCSRYMGSSCDRDSKMMPVKKTDR
jgi:hypothetical protein